MITILEYILGILCASVLIVESIRLFIYAFRKVPKEDEE